MAALLCLFRTNKMLFDFEGNNPKNSASEDRVNIAEWMRTISEMQQDYIS